MATVPTFFFPFHGFNGVSRGEGRRNKPGLLFFMGYIAAYQLSVNMYL